MRWTRQKLLNYLRAYRLMYGDTFADHVAVGTIDCLIRDVSKIPLE